MKRTKINVLLELDQTPGSVLIKGWVRTKRNSKTFSFMEINDGSCLKNLQVIANNDLGNYADVEKLTTGSAVSVQGELVESPGKGQRWRSRHRMWSSLIWHLKPTRSRKKGIRMNS